MRCADAGGAQLTRAAWRCTRRGAVAGARSAGALPQQLCELLRRPAGSSGASDGLHACSRLLAAGQQGRHHWPLTAAPWRPLAHRAARSGPARESWVRPLQIRPWVRQLQMRPLELCCRRLSSLPVRRRRGPAGPRAGRRSEAGGGGRCQGLCWRHLPGWPSRACTCRPPGRAPLRRRAGCPRP